MRLTTIWSPAMRGYSLRERLRRTREWAALEAAHRVPRRFAYWVFIAHGARHCGGSQHPNEVVPEVPFTVVLERLGKEAKVA